MNRLFYPSLLLLSVVISCISEKEGDLLPDCSSSGLALAVTATTTETCDTPGSITVSATGGASPYTYSINGTDFVAESLFSGLSANIYTITVKDSNNCTAETTGTVTATEGSIEVTVASQTASACDGNSGSVNVSATGGDGNYDYSLDGGATQSSASFGSLGVGAHMVEVTDGNGCMSSVSFDIVSSTSLANDIMPIIQANCAISSNCHGTGASGRPVFKDKAKVLEYATTIKQYTGSGYMPPASQPDLTAAEIATIACWVNDGAKDN